MGARILAVEDTPHNLYLMTYLLEAAGHEVKQATTGTDGLAAARTSRPDLVLLDIQLPDIDGERVLTLLREDPVLADVPVVAVTAYAMVGDRDKKLSAGFDGYLSKPLDPETFVASVEVHLPPPLRGSPLKPTWVGDFGAHQAVNARTNDGRQVLATGFGALNLSVVRSTLELHGYRLVAVDTVGQAREEATASRPDLVLVEVEEPKGGTSLLTRLRRIPQLADAQFALVATANMASALPEPALPVIASPIDPEVLLARLDELTKSRQG